MPHNRPFYLSDDIFFYFVVVTETLWSLEDRIDYFIILKKNG